jgi:hypothetical protein
MLRITEIHRRPQFMRLEEEWNALVERGRNAVNERHEFFRIFMDTFHARWRGVRILLARDDGGRLRGVLPLIGMWAFLYGLPVRRLASAINHYFTRVDMVTDDPDRVPRAFLAHLRRDCGWDVLSLSYAASNAHLWRLYDLGLRQRLKAACHETIRSPYISLTGSMDPVYARLKPKFRANLRRRRNKLKEKGTVELELFTAGPDLDRKLRAGLDIEGGGWKGKQGTAILTDPAARRFYFALASEASRRGYLALYFLKVGGRPVAFHFGLRYNGAYLFLKPGYDESLKEYSPGHLLVEEVLKDCVAAGLREFDFLAEDMPWKQEWTRQARPHSTLYLFPESLYGRLLWEVKSKGVPLAKDLLARLRALRPKPLSPAPA